jgi:preprotein translocase subunit SecA
MNKRFNALGIAEEVAPEAEATPTPPPTSEPRVVGAGRGVTSLSNNTPSGPIDFTNVGRNDPCPCGSGKKFKKCHGA